MFSFKDGSILTINYSFSSFLALTSLVRKLYILLRTVLDIWSVLIMEVF